MPSINKVTIGGHLGRDIEIRTTQNGFEIGSFSVATSKRLKDKQTGEYKDKTTWHNVVIFNDFVLKKIRDDARKGVFAYVEGEIETRKYNDSNGNEKYVTEIIVSQYSGNVLLFGVKSSSLDKNDQNYEDEIPF